MSLGSPPHLRRRSAPSSALRWRRALARLKAVHFLHRSAGALHRDVKPQNFGFARPVVQELGLGGRFLGGLGRENKSERGVVLILGLTV